MSMVTDSAGSAIEFENVTKVYADGTLAVEGCSLSVPAGKITVLVGSSGSGKTTLLKMINRMVEPSSGRVIIGGSDVRDADPVKLRRSIGYVLQHGGLLPHRTVIDNIAFVARFGGASRAEARERSTRLLDLVGLEPELGTRYPEQLSGGQQQRVGVARALAADPTVLLMDEPFGSVDPIVRRELQDELLRLQRDLSKTVVFVTHDVDEAFRLGDLVVVMRAGGVIAQQGSPAELLAAPADDFVRHFIGVDQGHRALGTEQIGGRTVVVDRAGRPLGMLAQ